MSQLEKLKNLFDEMKVQYSVDPLDDGRTAIQMDSGSGYVSFFAEFTFDAEGKLIKYGCWE